MSIGPEFYPAIVDIQVLRFSCWISLILQYMVSGLTLELELRKRTTVGRDTGSVCA